MMSSVDIHNTKKEEIEKSNNGMYGENKDSQPKYYCSIKQLLIIVIPITVVLLFAAIFIPVYIMDKKNDDKEEPIVNNNYYYENDGYDEFEENIINITYATLTPKYGYDNILIFLGGISEPSNYHFDLFKSKNTFVPRGTKIYVLCGQPRVMQFMVERHNYDLPVPGWFNIDTSATLRPTPHDFTQAKESLNLVLDEIDRIKAIEKVEYKNIYLAGFSQGAMMTNYILLNSRHELGGYIAFSGYVFDHDFSENEIVDATTATRKAKLEKSKNYHILATHSFADDAVFYHLSAESYRVYYHDYTDFKLLSFGELLHVLPEQPTHPFVKKWLRESMGK